MLYGDLMRARYASLAGKGGTIVVTGIAPITQTESSVNLFELAMWNKEIKGTIFGSLNPRADIPRLLGMYREGQLKLDELITKSVLARRDQHWLPGHARRREHPRGHPAWVKSCDLGRRGDGASTGLVGRLSASVVGRRREIELTVAAIAADRHVVIEDRPAPASRRCCAPWHRNSVSGSSSSKATPS